MSRLTRLLDDINTIAKAVERATRRHRRFNIRRKHIETAIDIGGTVLSLFGGKYKAAGHAAILLGKLQQHIKENADDSNGQTNRDGDSDGEHSNRPVHLHTVKSE